MTATAEKTGAELLAYLKETGTGAARLELLSLYLRDHPNATASAAVEHMRANPTRFAFGTVRKAGKFAHGDEWDCVPENMTPSDEVTALRQENAGLARALKAKEAECARLLRDAESLRKDLNHYKDKERAGARGKAAQPTA